jgi:hypothetical protein
MTTMRIFVALLALTLLGCNTPAEWAEQLDSQAKCGMSPVEVERIASRQIVPVKPPRGWATHVIRDDHTEVWLGFSDRKLEWLQVAWAVKMQRMATYQKVDLCGLSRNDPDARHPLPSN